MSDTPTSVDHLIRDAASRLRSAGVDTPEHDAKLLLAEACGVELRDVDKALLLGDPLERLLDQAPQSDSVRFGTMDDEEGRSGSVQPGIPCSDASSVGGSRSTPTMSDQVQSGQSYQAQSQANQPQASSPHIAQASLGHVIRSFRSMVGRRAGREPLQYIVGHAPFRYLDLLVGPGVFIPRPETETVVQAGLDWLDERRRAAGTSQCGGDDVGACGDAVGIGDSASLDRSGGDNAPYIAHTAGGHIGSDATDSDTIPPHTFRVVDLCAGSGAIGLSVVTETDDTEVWAVELSRQTAEWTRRNAQRVAHDHHIPIDVPVGFPSELSSSCAAPAHTPCHRPESRSTLSSQSAAPDTPYRHPEVRTALTPVNVGVSAEPEADVQTNASASTDASDETNANAPVNTDDRYHLVLGDAMAPGTLADLDGTVDLIVSNPPYVPESEPPQQPEVRHYDPETALYGGSPDGLRIPERIIERAAALLRPGGLLVMEHDISQGEALVAYAKSHGFVNAHTGMDWTGRPRYLSARRAV